jgi:hypothetical protein
MTTNGPGNHSATPLAQIEVLANRIAAAIESRTDLDAAVKASWCSDAKELFYVVLAASDLLRDGRAVADSVIGARSLLDRVDSGEARLASELSALGSQGQSLRQELETALASWRDLVRERLPAVTDKGPKKTYPRVVQRGPEDYVLPCSQCGKPAVIIMRSPKYKPGDRWGVAYGGITRRSMLEAEAMVRIFGWLEAGDLAALHDYMNRQDDEDGGLDAYCPDCDRIYCRAHYYVREEWDQGFYDRSYGRCPEGHDRMIDD